MSLIKGKYSDSNPKADYLWDNGKIKVKIVNVNGLKGLIDKGDGKNKFIWIECQNFHNRRKWFTVYDTQFKFLFESLGIETVSVENQWEELVENAENQTKGIQQFNELLKKILVGGVFLATISKKKNLKYNRWDNYIKYFNMTEELEKCLIQEKRLKQTRKALLDVPKSIPVEELKEVKNKEEFQDDII